MDRIGKLLSDYQERGELPPDFREKLTARLDRIFPGSLETHSLTLALGMSVGQPMELDESDIVLLKERLPDVPYVAAHTGLALLKTKVAEKAQAVANRVIHYDANVVKRGGTAIAELFGECFLPFEAEEGAYVSELLRRSQGRVETEVASRLATSKELGSLMAFAESGDVDALGDQCPLTPTAEEAETIGKIAATFSAGREALEGLAYATLSKINDGIAYAALTADRRLGSQELADTALSLSAAMAGEFPGGGSYGEMIVRGLALEAGPLYVEHFIGKEYLHGATNST